MKKSTQFTAIVQFVSALALVLALGLALTQSADAQKYAKGFTQAKSIAATQEMCELGGGSFSVKDSPFEGVKISKCSGGDMDGYTCGHGKKSANCSYQIVSQGGTSIVIDNLLQATVAEDTQGAGRTVESNGQFRSAEPGR